MHITIVQDAVFPVVKYGGTERVVWYLAKELVALGHKVTLVANQGSVCAFADVIPLQKGVHITKLLPKNTDVVHFHSVEIQGIDEISHPKVLTMHGNPLYGKELDHNTVFVSKKHANRYNSDSYVYNGLDWSDYGAVDLGASKDFFHFLGKGAWRVKNLRGAIQLVKTMPHEKLYVFGGKRFNFSMGLRFTFTPKARFFGLVDNEMKKKYLPHSKGLLFPVLWNEPFGLALIESLYFGSPVFGTPYGSLPELIIPEVGFLSDTADDLQQAMCNWHEYDPKVCHHYATENFNSKKMALRYLKKYEQVIDNQYLNSNKPSLLQTTPKFLPWVE